MSEEAALSTIVGTLGNRIFNIEGAYYSFALPVVVCAVYVIYYRETVFILHSGVSKQARLCGRSQARSKDVGILSLLQLLQFV